MLKMSAKTINDYFTLDLWHELVSMYLNDRIGFLRQIHSTWKNAIDDLKFPSKSFLGFLTESDALLNHAKQLKLSISEKTLINNVQNLNLHPVVLFDEPFHILSPIFLYHYIYHQKGERCIELLEYLLNVFPQTMALIKISSFWKILFNVLLFASDDVLFEWFVSNAEKIFGIKLNDENLVNIRWTTVIFPFCVSIDFGPNINDRIVRTILKFPILTKIDIYASLFCHILVINFDQIQTLCHQSDTIDVTFFEQHFFCLSYRQSPFKNEFVTSLFDNDIKKLEFVFFHFRELFPTFDHTKLDISFFIGYCIATQWVEGTEFFLNLGTNYIDCFVAKQIKLKPLSKDFWNRIRSRLSKTQQYQVLDFFCIMVF